MGLSTFNKTGYKSSDEIAFQYDRKIALLLHGRNESALNKQELEIFNVLNSLKELDPRHKDVCFGLEEEATIGIAIADKLETMSDDEFLISSYPFEWINELKQKTVCRVKNQEMIDLIEDLYKDNKSSKDDLKNLEVEQRKRRIEQVINQYEKRIIALLNGRKKDQLLGSDKESYDILVRASMYDPRRPDVGFGTKEMVEKGFEISAKLDALSDEQFLIDPYILEWIDTIGDGMKINNLPIDNI